MFEMYVVVLMALIIIRSGASPKVDDNNSTQADALVDAYTTTTTIGFITLAPIGLILH